MAVRFDIVRARAIVPAALIAVGVVLLAVAWRGHVIRLGVTGVAVLVLALALASPLGQRWFCRTRMLSPSQDEPLGLLPIYLWVALAAGLGEVAIVSIRTVYFYTMYFIGPEFAWMVPLMYLLLLGIVALVLHVLRYRWPRIVSERNAVFVLAAGGYTLVLLNFGMLEISSVGLIAVGLAWQTARMVEEHPRVCRAVVRSTLGWSTSVSRPRPVSPMMHPTLPSRRAFLMSTGATLAGIAVGVQGWRELTEWGALARLPVAQSGVPNVLLIVLDTVRARSLGMYGYSRPTSPNLDAFASRGVRFAQAIAPAPWTLPSHASMFTGHLPHDLGVSLGNPLDKRYPTLAEVLASQGFETAAFVDNTTIGNHEYGLNRGFAHYVDYRVSLANIALSPAFGRRVSKSTPAVSQFWSRHFGRGNDGSGDTPVGAEHISAEFLDWQARQTGRPYFAFLNYFDAHDPYLPPTDFALRFSSTETPNGWFNFETLERLTSSEIQDLNNAYDASIAYIDHHIGGLVGELDRRGTLDSTLVVIVGDHGEQFGEHGLMQHSNSLYMPLLHVPLLISLPGRVPSGTVVDTPASLRDIPNTVLDLLGLKPPVQFPGRPLGRYWSGDRSLPSVGSEAIVSETAQLGPPAPMSYPARRGAMQSVISNNMHYIRNLGDGRQELYDLSLDPLEQHDLSATDAGRRMVEELSHALERSATGGA